MGKVNSQSFPMLNITEIIANELFLSLHNVNNALELLQEGATIPFIARLGFAQKV